MKKFLRLFPLFVILLFASCDVSDNDDEFTDSFSYQIQQQSAITFDTTQQPIEPDSLVTVFNFNIEQGNNTVFSYEHNVIAPPDVADGGFFETLVFQAPANIDEFEYRDEELQQGTAFYRYSCFCQLAGAGFKVTSGVIRGERLSPIHWIIRADVRIETATGNFEVEFKEPFYVE